MAVRMTLYFRVKTDDGWRRFPVAYGKNGRVRPGFVMVEGEPIEFPSGTYEIRHVEHGKRVWTSAGTHASEALALMLRMERKKEAKAIAGAAGLEIVPEVGERKTIAEWAELFARDSDQRGATEASAMNRRYAAEFLRIVWKEYPHELTRGDLFDYMDGLRKKGNSDRTISNKLLRTRSILKFAGVDAKVIPDPPRYEKKLPTTYTPDNAGLVIKSCAPRLALILSVALKTGLREQELMHLQFSDIDMHSKILKVQGKPDYGFKVKDSEQREVPIPTDLLGQLEEWNKQHPGRRLLFGTKQDKPDGHLLRGLKRAAKSAGLNCGRCDGCNSKRKECREWTLHKFRRSYLTTLLRHNVDLRTVQALAGHTDLASTMRYLRPASATETHAKINEIQWH